MRAISALQDLVGATLFFLGARQVEVVFIVDNGGKKQKARQTLKVTEVSSVSLALVYLNVKQLESHYRLEGSSIVCTFNTDRDWWILVLQMEPFRGGETLPMMMMEWLIHERGIPCGKARTERTFPKPDDYVDFEIKWEIVKRCPDFRKPSS